MYRLASATPETDLLCVILLDESQNVELGSLGNFPVWKSTIYHVLSTAPGQENMFTYHTLATVVFELIGNARPVSSRLG
jgi:hypothetical protein